MAREPSISRVSMLWPYRKPFGFLLIAWTLLVLGINVPRCLKKVDALTIIYSKFPETEMDHFFSGPKEPESVTLYRKRLQDIAAAFILAPRIYLDSNYPSRERFFLEINHGLRFLSPGPEQENYTLWQSKTFQAIPKSRIKIPTNIPKGKALYIKNTRPYQYEVYIEQ